MPVPMFMARVNRKIFNPREIAKGVRPVITHVGRRSGHSHKTPLDAHEVDGGYVFIAMYGRDADWVKNVVAAGRATLQVDGDEIELRSPRFIPPEEVWQSMPATAKPPASFLRVTDYLRMDRSAS